MTFAESLELGDDLWETLVTHVFQFADNTGAEEDLGKTDTVFALVQLQSFNQFLDSNLSVHESGWDSGGSQNLVTEMMEKKMYVLFPSVNYKTHLFTAFNWNSQINSDNFHKIRLNTVLLR